MSIKTFAAVFLIILHSAVLMSMDKPRVYPYEGPMQEFELTIKGRRHHSYGSGCYIFDDELYETQSKKYAQLNKLRSLELTEYTGSIDYGHTYIFSEERVVIVTPEGEFNQAATGGVYDCVGVVFQQLAPDGKVVKTMAAHVSERMLMKDHILHERKLFSDFTDIADPFFEDRGDNTVRVSFVATYNTDHLLELYDYVRSKEGILDEHITLTGNFPADKRPVRTRFEQIISCKYFPGSYYEIAHNKEPPTEANPTPLTEVFWDKYLCCTDLFVDAGGKVYPRIKGFLEGLEFDNDLNYPAPLNRPHIKIGFKQIINRSNSYFLVPNTTAECIEKLRPLEEEFKREREKRTALKGELTPILSAGLEPVA